MSMYRVAPAIIGLLLCTSTLSAQPNLSAVASHTTARAHPTIYVDIKGTKQGQFPGDVPPAELKAHPHEIAALSLAYETEVPRNPQTGQATGKRIQKPVMFTHDVSAATPDLFQAAATNEVLTTVTITVWKADPNGMMSAHYTLTLTDAIVTSLRQFTEENILMEEVALTFRKMEIKVGAKTVTDDWM
jgi:type VI secretion system secreted protein Hcp